MVLRKINITGEVYYNVFKDAQGNIVRDAITQEAYKSLAKPDCINPTKDGYDWDYSYSAYLFDTGSGEFEDDCFTLSPDGSCYLFKLAGCGQVSAHLDEIDADGNLDQAREEYTRNHFSN